VVRGLVFGRSLSDGHTGLIVIFERELGSGGSGTSGFLVSSSRLLVVGFIGGLGLGCLLEGIESLDSGGLGVTDGSGGLHGGSGVTDNLTMELDALVASVVTFTVVSARLVGGARAGTGVAISRSSRTHVRLASSVSSETKVVSVVRARFGSRALAFLQLSSVEHTLGRSGGTDHSGLVSGALLGHILDFDVLLGGGIHDGDHRQRSGFTGLNSGIGEIFVDHADGSLRLGRLDGVLGILGLAGRVLGVSLRSGFSRASLLGVGANSHSVTVAVGDTFVFDSSFIEFEGGALAIGGSGAYLLSARVYEAASSILSLVFFHLARSNVGISVALRCGAGRLRSGLLTNGEDGELVVLNSLLVRCGVFLSELAVEGLGLVSLGGLNRALTGLHIVLDEVVLGVAAHEELGLGAVLSNVLNGSRFLGSGIVFINQVGRIFFTSLNL
jgi:hypothetical protein